MVAAGYARRLATGARCARSEGDKTMGFAEEMHSNALVEVLALLDRLEASGQDFDPELIRIHVPEPVRIQLAQEVARVNAELTEAGF